MARVREWRLPREERHAARAERHAMGELRAQRDNEWRADRRAASVAAEARRYASFVPPGNAGTGGRSARP